MKFNQGDRVRVLNHDNWPEVNGATGFVNRIDESDDVYPYCVVFDNPLSLPFDSEIFAEEELEAI